MAKTPISLVFWTVTYCMMATISITLYGIICMLMYAIRVRRMGLSRLTSGTWLEVSCLTQTVTITTL